MSDKRDFDSDLANGVIFAQGGHCMLAPVLADGMWFREAMTTRKMVDSPEDLEVIVERLCEDLEWRNKQIALAEQTHGAEVAVIREPIAETMPADSPSVFPGVDALVCDCPDVILAIFTADCVPILFVDDGMQVAGAVHAGWRGTMGRILPNALRAAFHLGARPEWTQLWIGPAISGKNYEVDQNLAGRFAKKFPRCAETAVRGRHVDLPAINRWEALEAGLLESNVEVCGLCTKENDILCSYRRDGAEAGRMAAAIWLESR